MTRQIIRDKRASGASDDSLLSRLIQAADDDGLGFSEEDLVGHISLMLWGSRDAVAAALTWSLFLISMHERVQESIVSELEALLSGHPPSVQQLAQLPMTEHALKESLRLLPPFPMLDRVAAADTEVAGYEVPQGTEFIMSIFHTHRMPKYYEEPSAYRPERWQKINPELFQFMPFGGGPRMCPGSNLAWQELVTIVAMLLARFRFEIVDNARIDRIVKLGLLPKQGMPMRVLVQDKEYSKSVKSIRGNLKEMVSTLV
jgi:cytochrome P450